MGTHVNTHYVTYFYLQSHSCDRGGSRGGWASVWRQCLLPSAGLGGVPVSVGQRGGGRSVMEGVVGMSASTASMLMPADASSAQGRRAEHLIFKRRWGARCEGVGRSQRRDGCRVHTAISNANLQEKLYLKTVQRLLDLCHIPTCITCGAMKIKHTLCPPCSCRSRWGQANKHATYVILCSDKCVKSLLVNRHSQRRRGAEMKSRRMGGGERGMSRAPVQCICSAAASAVNSQGWTYTYSGTNTHSPTHSAACGTGTPQRILHV